LVLTTNISVAKLKLTAILEIYRIYEVSALYNVVSEKNAIRSEYSKNRWRNCSYFTADKSNLYVCPKQYSFLRSQ
jgi:hypothetical protein